MSRISNLRLGARLAVAFGVLAVALAVVSAVAFTKLTSVGNETAKLGSGKDAHALESVDDARTSLHNMAHGVVRHLYVYDGDLKTEDRIAAKLTKENATITRALNQVPATLTTSRAKAAFAVF